MTTKIAVVTGTIRSGRVNKKVADWVLDFANNMNIEEAQFELVDIKDYPLPLFEGDIPPGALNKQYPSEDIQKWGDKIDEFDGYIFITAEYNKAISGALKNHLDHIGPEFQNKAASVIGYGSTLGVTAAQSLRLILANQNVAVPGVFGAFDMFTDFSDGEFTPKEVHHQNMEKVIHTTVNWAKALKTIR